MNDNTINAIHFVVGLGILTVGYWFLWSDLRLDRFRHTVFVIRDELFSEAEKKAAFGDAHYRAARESLNSLLRHAHTMSPLLFVVIAWRCGRTAPKESPFCGPLAAEIKHALVAAYTATDRFVFKGRIHGWLLRPLFVHSMRRSIPELEIHLGNLWQEFRLVPDRPSTVRIPEEDRRGRRH